MPALVDGGEVERLAPRGCGMRGAVARGGEQARAKGREVGAHDVDARGAAGRRVDADRERVAVRPATNVCGSAGHGARTSLAASCGVGTGTAAIESA